MAHIPRKSLIGGRWSEDGEGEGDDYQLEEFEEDGGEFDGFFGEDDEDDPDYSGSERGGRDDIPIDPALSDGEEDEPTEDESEEDLSMDLFNNEMEDFHQDLKAAHGFRRRRPNGGRRAVGDENYSFEVRSLLGQANQAYAFGKLEEALKAVKQIIQIEPGVYAAWKILGEIFSEKGDKNKCLLAWLTAAHARPKDWELWLMCAKMSLDQYGPDKQSYRDQAIYCYNRAIRANPDNIDAIYDRSLLLKDSGQLTKAAEGFVMLNRLLPNDMGILKELAGLYIELGRIPEAIDFYNRSVEFFRSTGNADMAFGWSELNIFAELYCMEKEWAVAIQTIKSLGRWLYGRAEEKYWDQINGDDREWDEEDRPRRCLVREFEADRFPKESYSLPLELRVKLGLCRLRMGNKDEAISHFQYLQKTANSNYNDLFQEVGDALYECRAYEDAINYYSVVVEAAEYLDRKLWFNMAECYRGIDNIEDSEDAYMTILEAYPTDEAAMMQLAGIYEVTNRKAEALELVNEIIRIRRERDAAEKSRKEALASGVALSGAEGSEAANENNTAMAFFPNQPVRERAKRKKAGMLTEAERAEMDAKKTEQTTVKFKKLEFLRPAAEAEDQLAIKDWLDTAGDLVDDFRNTRALYPQDRNLKFKGFMTTAQRRAMAQGQAKRIEKMQSRLQETLTFQDDEITTEHLTKFRGLDFDTWLYIFMQYAIYLAKYDNFQDAYDVCNAAKEANVFFQDKRRTFTIWITWLSCAILVGDSESCSTICRWFMTSFQFTTETYSLFTASITASKNGLEVFHNNANQKYLLRQIKAMDQAITGKTRVGAATLTAVDDDGNKYVPGDVDVGLLMLYGHILASGRSYISALNYYTRAFAVLPDNPMITFCIGLAYLHRSMQRQSENRHMQALQGMTFLFEYYDMRTDGRRKSEEKAKGPEHIGGESAGYVDAMEIDSEPAQQEKTREDNTNWEERQEAEYNIGRAFHHIGLTHLAIPYYQRVLEISDEQAQAGKPLMGDMKWEAAYNLQMIYVTSGSPGLAKSVTVKYLVL